MTELPLSTTGWVLLMIGVVFALHQVWRILVTAFQIHVLWGLIVLLVPGLGVFIFILKRWIDVGTYFLNLVLWIGFIVFMYMGYPTLEEVIVGSISNFDTDWDKTKVNPTN